MGIRQQSIREKSEGHRPGSIVSSRRQAAGFTLIELLVAMGILMVIVLMMANLFQQSSIAWNTGIRQAEAGLEARAVLGMIQKELSQAVAGEGRSPFAVTDSGRTLAFWTLGEVTPESGVREARRVTYSFSGGRVRKNSEVDLIENVVRFEVTPSTTNPLPAWVDVFMEVSTQRDRSQVRVWAIGHEGVADTRR